MNECMYSSSSIQRHGLDCRVFFLSPIGICSRDCVYTGLVFCFEKAPKTERSKRRWRKKTIYAFASAIISAFVISSFPSLQHNSACFLALCRMNSEAGSALVKTSFAFLLVRAQITSDAKETSRQCMRQKKNDEIS